MGGAYGGTISNAYASTRLIGSLANGGFAGIIEASNAPLHIQHAFADAWIAASGQNNSDGAFAGQYHTEYGNEVLADVYANEGSIGFHACYNNSNGEPTTEGLGCSLVNANNQSTAFFVGTTSISPVASWNFDTIWTAVSDSLPALTRFINPSDLVTLTEVTPVQNPVAAADAVYAFSISNPNQYTGTYIVSYGCGTPTVNATTSRVTFSGLTAGQTYSCDLRYIPDSGPISNVLSIGPFTVTGASSTPESTSTPQVASQTVVLSGSSGGSVASQVRALTQNGNLRAANALKSQYPHVFATATSSPLSPSSSSAMSGIKVRNLKQGVSGDDVRALQKVLNGLGYTVRASGPGSKGNESTYFGASLKQALIRYQKANGIVPASGVFGPQTRAAIKSAKPEAVWW
jgi:hypothetical protein